MLTKSLATTLVHVGRKKRYTQGSVNPVVQRASSLVFDSLADKKHATINRAKGELFYGRRGTLTHFALQDAMTELEGGAGCYLYPCGAAAVTNSILSFVENGDHVLMTGAAYEPTQDFCNVVLKKLGVSTTFYDPMIGGKIADLVQPNTKVLFLEAPSSLTMEVADIPAIVSAVRNINPEIVIMIDNTWAAGVLFKALEHGIDISIQAGTKYLVGHSDVMIGTAVANARCWDQLREHSYLMGQMVDADSAYTTIRGLRTLNIRLKQHEESSIKVAQWLAQQPEVKAVYHPALPSCPGNTFFKRDFSGSSGLFSFELKQN
ncbi:Cystathionine beta-lyase metC [Aggregatibacter aphrophilus]|uniref:Cystathionine beta-lyase metC n=1 Tax=Aggregatibacter aphrophilus TaxID=732 RepID=A0A336N1Y5_AGGAP|nr:Cystathionine beta-lyase metC [Aggregatibacter aphrophilus]